MTAIGALIGLSLSILLIIRKLSPTYSLIIGAIVGGLLLSLIHICTLILTASPSLPIGQERIAIFIAAIIFWTTIIKRR